MPISTIEQGIAEIRMGKALIVVDDADRENEGDLMVAAEAVTPEHINFMAKHAGGLVCMPVPGDRLDALQLPPAQPNARELLGTEIDLSPWAAQSFRFSSVTPAASPAGSGRSVLISKTPGT